MPIAEPGNVSEALADDFGTSVSLDRAGSDRPSDLRQAPINHQRLAMLAHDDVGRLDVAMQHAPRVGIVDGVADVDESSQQLAQLQRAAGPGSS